MKKKITISLLTAGLLLGALTGCGPKENSSVSNSASNSGDPSQSTSVTQNYSFTASAPKTISKGETAVIEITENNKPEGVTTVFSFTSSDAAVATVDSKGVITAVGKGTATIAITESTFGKRSQVVVTVSEAVVANGGFNYASLAGQEAINTRTEILGKLEKYAMDNHLTGITLFENGGYMKYASRVQLPTTKYITSYGFGLLTEGTLNADMASEKESNANHRRYLHSATSSDPGTINSRNDTGSQVSDLESYIAASYWGTKMNKTKDGYVWYPVLAKDTIKVDGVSQDFDRPLPVFNGNVVKPNENPNPLGLYKSWRIYVKTGAADGLKFRYNGGTWEGKTFEKRDVTIEDYEFAYYFLLTGSHKMKRGLEAASDQTYGLKGALKYYNKTLYSDDEGAKTIWNDMKSRGDLGIKTGSDSNGEYIELTIINAIDRFTAMYTLSSNLYTPIPEEFLKTIGNGSIAKGAKRYGTATDDTSLGSHSGKIMDMTICVGPFMLEQWSDQQSITFKRNDTYNEAGRYNIPGLKLLVIDSSTDADAIYNQYNAGLIDSCSIPAKHLPEEKNQPGVYKARGDSTFKLNVNSCSQEMWDKLFGVGGKINPEGSDWDVKPWMSNDNFLKGLYYAIDRKTFAGNRGVNPSINYFADSYLSDPERGISYNDSQAHKDAIKNYEVYDDKGNSLFGYSKDKAIIAFKSAVNELVRAGHITKGTKNNPTNITVSITWMYESDIKEYGEEIESYMESAFNDEAVCNGTVKLDVVSSAVKNWQDVYNEVMMKGQFDLAFGAISGNTYNPLNFLEVLKSDNSSGFTLNWGPDTSEVNTSDPLVYNDNIWSFDSLWAAADHGSVVENGKNVKPVKEAYMSYDKNDYNDGATFWIDVNFFEASTVKFEVKEVSLYIFSSGSNELNYTVETDGAHKGALRIELTKAQANEFRDEMIRALKLCDDNKPQTSWVRDPFKVDNYNTYWNIDIKYEMSIKDQKTGEWGTPSESYVTAAKNKAAWKDE